MLWKLLAFCSRYGHQQLSELWRLPMSDLSRYAKEIGKLIEDENGDPLRRES